MRLTVSTVAGSSSPICRLIWLTASIRLDWIMLRAASRMSFEKKLAMKVIARVVCPGRAKRNTCGTILYACSMSNRPISVFSSRAMTSNVSLSRLAKSCGSV